MEWDELDPGAAVPVCRIAALGAVSGIERKRAIYQMGRESESGNSEAKLDIAGVYRDGIGVEASPKFYLK